MPLSQTLNIIGSGIERGLHVGAQCCVIHHGQVILDTTLGIARPEVPMAPQSITCWMSAGKPLTAVAIALLWQRGKLSLDDTVASHIPEFSAGGKEAITIRHLLTHTAGIRHVGNATTTLTWDQVIDQICRVRIEPHWTPGQKAGYHIASSWFVLGEIIRRIDGRPVDQYLREDIFLPLGMTDSWMGIPESQFTQYGDRIAMAYNTADPAHPNPNPSTASPAAAALVRPGANARGPLHDLARFYQMLLNHGSLNGVRILSPQTVEAITARHRTGLFDHTFGHTMDWALGFAKCSNHYENAADIPYNFGPAASARTFGHGGHQCAIAFADPERELVFTLLLNGMPGESAHHARMTEILASLDAAIA